jgi:hypothetical protein
MSKRILPIGEETLPILEIGGKLFTPKQIKSGFKAFPAHMRTVNDDMLIERVKMRKQQGRMATIYHTDYELSPDDQIRHMKLRDKIGLELISAERKLLEEEIRILKEEYGSL